MQTEYSRHQDEPKQTVQETNNQALLPNTARHPSTSPKQNLRHSREEARTKLLAYLTRNLESLSRIPAHAISRPRQKPTSNCNRLVGTAVQSNESSPAPSPHTSPPPPLRGPVTARPRQCTRHIILPANDQHKQQKTPTHPNTPPQETPLAKTEAFRSLVDRQQDPFSRHLLARVLGQVQLIEAGKQES